MLAALAAWRLGAMQVKDPREVRETSVNTPLKADLAAKQRETTRVGWLDVGLKLEHDR